MATLRGRARTGLRTIAGSLAAAVGVGLLSLAMALVINLGILGAIGTPEGPGHLGLIAPASTGTNVAASAAPCPPVTPIRRVGEAPPNDCSASVSPTLPKVRGHAEPPDTAEADD
jgi:hypothetical protein